MSATAVIGHARAPEAPRPDATCRACPGDCADACFNGAIQDAPGGGFMFVATACAGCGGCVSACALGRIAVIGGAACFVPNPPPVGGPISIED